MLTKSSLELARYPNQALLLHRCSQGGKLIRRGLHTTVNEKQLDVMQEEGEVLTRTKRRKEV